jgi:hypothetical protein
MGTGRGRRLAIRLAACAVIGGVATVAMAWGLAALLEARGQNTPTPACPTRLGSVWLNKSLCFGGARYSFGVRFEADLDVVPTILRYAMVEDLRDAAEQLRLQGSGPRWRSLKLLDRGTLGVPQGVHEERGWPFLALCCEWLDDGPTRADPLAFSGEFKAANGGLELARKGPARTEPTLRALPLWPLFPGFALDTAFYAAIALALWSAPPAIRRRVRLARGHCPACGYDLKGAPSKGGATCPECGP